MTRGFGATVMEIAIAIALAAAAAASCKGSSEVGGGPDGGGGGGAEADAAGAPDAAWQCADDDECAALDPARPRCADDGRCVACRSAADCSDPAAPVCDATERACRACAADAECPSRICDLDEGTCVDPDAIYYVDDDAPCGTGDGGAGAPFCSVAEALAAFATAPRTWVHVADGAYTFPTLTQPALPWWVGAGAAVVTPATPGGSCVEVAGIAALAVRGFRFVDCGVGVVVPPSASHALVGANAFEGGGRGVDCRGACVVRGATFTGLAMSVRCTGGALCQVLDSTIEAATDVGLGVSGGALDVVRTTIAGTAHAGIVAQDAQLTVLDSTVRGAGAAIAPGAPPGNAAGIACAGGSCTLRRSRIEGGRGAGLLLVDAAFVVQNCAILENGSTVVGAPYNGGVVIASSAPTQLFANNTVYGNRAGLDEVAGVRCTPGVTVVNSILWANSGLQLSPGPGACTARSSDVDQSLAEGVGNFRLDPRLASTTPGAIDVHLRADSPCIDAADALGAPVDDIDREERPIGIKPDVGADEVPK